MGISTDLILLAIDDKHGEIRHQPALAAALVAADLATLALRGQLGLDGVHLTVPTQDSAGDARLEATARLIRESRSPVTVSRWISLHAPKQVGRHLTQLEKEGLVQVAAPPSRSRPTKVHIADRDRAREAIDRFVRTATLQDPRSAALEDQAFAALADAADLTRFHLAGRSNRNARTRVATLVDPRKNPTDRERAVWAVVRAAARTIASSAARSGYSAIGSDNASASDLPGTIAAIDSTIP